MMKKLDQVNLEKSSMEELFNTVAIDNNLTKNEEKSGFKTAIG